MPWMDSVKDGSYLTPEQKEKLHQEAMELYQEMKAERESVENLSDLHKESESKTL